MTAVIPDRCFPIAMANEQWPDGLSPQLAFLRQDTLTAAVKLLGMVLEVNGRRVRIVGTEAYQGLDPASHAVTRSRAAGPIMNTWGRIYVYQIYGIHYCLNITTDEREAGAVLLRAAEPLDAGLFPRKLTSSAPAPTTGPARLCRALGVDKTFSGQVVGESIALYPGNSPEKILCSPRVGISKAVDVPWRFFLEDNPFVSRVRENRLAQPLKKRGAARPFSE